LKAYSSYKDSGIEWIGPIPSHWEVKSVKHISNNLDGKRIPLNSAERAKKRGEYPYYGATGILDFVDDYIFDGDFVLIGEDGAPFFIQERDVSRVASGKFWVNNHAHILKPNAGISPQLLSYYLNCVDYKKYITGSTRDKLTQDQLSNIKVLLPSYQEQTAIAAYLDRQTAQIDQLIADKQKLLQLYDEEKTALINRAITQGLNPHVPLKNSGIEWLGDIPEHWEVKRFKYYFQLITEKVDTELPKIGLENIESNTGNFLETNSEFSGDGIRFKPLDILFGKLRPYLAKVWLSNFEGKAVGDFYIFRTNNEVIPEYAKYRILDSSFINITNSSTYGSKMPRVSWEFIANLPIAIPNIEEQQAIVRHIENQCAHIDVQRARTQKLIALLQEYRTALISEAVTGKIKVTDET